MKLTIIFFAPLFLISEIYAADQIETEHLTANEIAKYFSSDNKLGMKILSQHIDFNKTNHVRFQQTYYGHEIFGADVILHIPQSNTLFTVSNLLNSNISMNGVIYQNLEKDLLDTSTKKPISFVTEKIKNKNHLQNLTSAEIIFIDKNSKAHWAYKISYQIITDNQPSHPTLILDAQTLEIYDQWDNIKTTRVFIGGGFGGNPKRGQIIYDGGINNLIKLDIERQENTCYMQNNQIQIINKNTNATTQYHCQQVDVSHNNTYWNGSLDQANGGFSPSNDTLYGIQVVSDLYQNWYNIPVLTQNNQPMKMIARVHDNYDNAFWDGKQLILGDGIRLFYPLTTLDVIGHELSHGFTEQHSNLIYRGQSGGLNESFSDMAGEATRYFARGKTSWVTGDEMVKLCDAPKNCGLRFLNDPTRDGRSIDHTNNYRNNMSVHHSSGIYNKAFYLLSTSEGWNIHKAFDVMVKANIDYWTSNTNFNAAGCGVIKAANDYHYDDKSVRDALTKVGVKANGC